MSESIDSARPATLLCKLCEPACGIPGSESHLSFGVIHSAVFACCRLLSCPSPSPAAAASGGTRGRGTYKEVVVYITAWSRSVDMLGFVETLRALGSSTCSGFHSLPSDRGRGRTSIAGARSSMLQSGGEAVLAGRAGN